MYLNILVNKQLELLPVLSNFFNSFYLVGGTAIALQIGHRQSVDFDFFSQKKLKPNKIRDIFNKNKFKLKTIYEDGDQIQGIINDVRITFYEYPFNINPKIKYQNTLKMPDILELAAMKAYALGRRGKWKDYVDLYFILKKYYNLADICRKAESIFKGEFSEKLFRQQLCYFKDINYSEPLEYLNNPIDNKTIEGFLVDIATSQF